MRIRGRSDKELQLLPWTIQVRDMAANGPDLELGGETLNFRAELAKDLFRLFLW